MDKTEFGNFTLQRKTEIFFGKETVNQNLLEALQKEGVKKVLFVYGRSSIKKIGLYDEVIEVLKKVGQFVELGGVRPNPEVSTVRKGAKICKEEGVDFILAVGGGSVIDCAKGIAIGAKTDHDVDDRIDVDSAVPIGTILTLPAAGSEMNNGTVVSNDKKGRKKGMQNPKACPVFSILDPTYTFSLSKQQTSAGSFDILSHCLECYFSKKGNFLCDRYLESIMKTVLHFLPIALADGKNYEARANLMFASTMALNGLNSLGTECDWIVHMMQHEWSALYPSLAHGDGLAILTIPYLLLVAKKRPSKLSLFGQNVLSVEKQDESLHPKESEFQYCNRVIATFQKWMRKCGLPKSFSEVIKDGATEKDVKISVEQVFEEMDVEDGKVGSYIKLSRKEVFDLSMECI